MTTVTVDGRTYNVKGNENWRTFYETLKVCDELGAAAYLDEWRISRRQTNASIAVALLLAVPTLGTSLIWAPEWVVMLNAGYNKRSMILAIKDERW